MTKSSFAFLAVFFISITTLGCTEAPPVKTDVAAVESQKPAEAASPIAPSKWIEGTHYKIIAEESTPQKEVVEFFSFWCPACYNFEGIVAEIKSNLSNDVTFKKTHVNFMGFTTQDIQEQATKGMLIGKALGKEELMIAAIFAHIHEQNQTINGIDDIRELFISYDFSASDFDTALASEAVKMGFANNNSEIEKFRSHLNGVPNIIVNGKYQAQFTRDMTLKDIVDLINWLSEQK
jgi:thiol:disulfide interchange protein DsbA